MSTSPLENLEYYLDRHNMWETLKEWDSKWQKRIRAPELGILESSGIAHLLHKTGHIRFDGLGFPVHTAFGYIYREVCNAVRIWFVRGLQEHNYTARHVTSILTATFSEDFVLEAAGHDFLTVQKLITSRVEELCRECR